jgi:hypothetical protein
MKERQGCIFCGVHITRSVCRWDARNTFLYLAWQMFAVHDGYEFVVNTGEGHGLRYVLSLFQKHSLLSDHTPLFIVQ